MTFSITARCPVSGMFGVAIASSSPAVAARCAHAAAGTGAVATQNLTDPALGPRALQHLSQGAPAEQVLRDSLGYTPFGEYRQLVIIGRQGIAAVHSGRHALPVAAAALGAHSAAAGNLLANDQVPAAMVARFEAGTGHFAARLLEALRAGAECGGETSPIHSAGLLVVREVSWPVVDLRVDWHDQPLPMLESIWHVYAPQLDDYVRRALDPAAAPPFAVPAAGARCAE